jgi:AmmeMemoRadiSam system protein A
MLSHQDRAALVGIARRALEQAVDRRELDFSSPQVEALLRPAGAFVTIRKKGELRGCIGLVEAEYPLWETVIRAATSAGTQDFRFSPLRPDELPIVRLELSVLSPLEEVKDLSAIQVGIHGLEAEWRGRRGLLLPQVARECRWDREQFLCYTCEKAGLPHSAWQEGATIYRFTAEVFGEEEQTEEGLYLYLNREEAIELLQRHLKSPDFVRRARLVSLVMRQAAAALEEDEPLWKLCGLLQEIDAELAAADPAQRGLAAEQILLQEGINGVITQAIKASQGKAPRQSPLEIILWAAQGLANFLYQAMALPDSPDLAKMDEIFLIDALNLNPSGPGYHREQIANCEQVGLKVESFIALGLAAAKKVLAQ